MSDTRTLSPLVDVRRPGRAAVAAKGMLRANKWLIVRRAAQLTLLAVFLSGPLAGIWIAKGTLASSMTFGVLPLTDPLVGLQVFLAGHALASTVLIGMTIVTAVYAIFAGRAYCSFVCPINLLTDAAHWIHRRFAFAKGWQPARQMRLWVLAMILLAAFLSGTVFWESVNPITMLHRELVFGTLWTSGFTLTMLAALFAFDVAVSRHGWCGHLCPVGAFYGLVGRFRLPVISAASRSKCDNCMLCYAVCPEPQVIAPALKVANAADASPLILSSDCTLCGRCTDVCPHSVFKLTTRFNTGIEPDRAAARRAAA